MNAYEELRHAAETAVADLRTGVSDTGFIVRYLERALKTPRRNCDVGTAEEQIRRVRAHCKQHRVGLMRCVDCPVKGVFPKDCALIWAQMPYKEEGAE